MFIKNDDAVRLERKEPASIGSVVPVYLRAMGLTAGMNTRRIFKAWEDATGAGKWTLKQFFRNGTLYVTLSSSVLRDRLTYEADVLVEKINAILDADPLFTKSDRFVGKVQKIVLK